MIKRIYEYFYKKNTPFISKEELLNNGFTEDELKKLKQDSVIGYEDNFYIKRGLPFRIYRKCHDSEDNRGKLYDYIYESQTSEIIKEELLKNNFTEEDINKLLKNNIVKYENNKYKILSLNDFLIYYLAITLIDDIEKQEYLFNNYDVSLIRNFLFFASRGDYYDSIKIFREMFKSMDEEDISNNNLLIYILANCTDELYEFYDYCYDLKVGGILNDVNYKNSFCSNEIRKNIFDRNFKEALRKLNGYKNRDFIKFLERAQKIKKQNSSNLHEWVTNEEYDKIISYFKKLEKKLRLTDNQKKIYYLSMQIRKMILSKKIPEIKKRYKDDFNSYIYSNDFKKAYEMCQNNILVEFLLKQAVDQMKILEEKQSKEEIEKIKTKNIDLILNLVKYGDIEFAQKMYDLYDYIPIRVFKNLINDLNNFKNVDRELFEYMCKSYNEKNKEEINWCLDQIWNSIPEISDESLSVLENHIKTKEIDSNELIKIIHNTIGEKKDVILLPPMKDEIALEIKEICKNYNNFSSVRINYNDKMMIGLLHTVKHSDSLIYLLDNSNRQYNDGEYAMCFDTRRVLLDFDRENSKNYNFMGKCSYKLGDKEGAIKYFTIANGLSEELDYSDVINKIKKDEKDVVLEYSKND